MVYKYGIDFGTTNSSIAIRFVGDDHAEHTLVIDVKDTLPRETLPSVVFVNENGKIVGGEKAVNEFLQHGGNKTGQLLIKRIKLDLETKGSNLSYYVGNKKYSGIDLIAGILRALRLKAEKAVQELDIEMSGVVMGVPVQYGDIQKNILKKALVKAGFYDSIEQAESRTEFVSEPVAVAVHYGLNLQHDKTVLVFDFGGGTLDLAIVNLKNQVGTDRLHPHETIAKERITLGGEELTRLFFINSFCDNKKYGLKRIVREFRMNAQTPKDAWEELHRSEEGIRFITAVEKCKCDLSRAQKYTFSYIGRNVKLDERSFYRDDFTDSIEDKLEEIERLIDTCLENGGIDDCYDIDHVILAGGSSMIPAVQDLLVDKFGASRVSSKSIEKDNVIKAMKRNRALESEVLTSIVRGLAAIGCRDESLIDDVVDSDYGAWDDETNEFFPIIEKGTPIKDTALDKITFHGIYQEVVSTGNNISSVEIKIYQKNINGVHKLGTINIPHPGGKKYRIFMQVDKKKGMLEVTIYDIIKRRWIDEIPLNERQYTLD